MVGPPVFSGISFEPSDSAEAVCVGVCVLRVFRLSTTTSAHICVLVCASLNGVRLCVGCGQLPCVHRGEVVPDTTGAVLLPQPWGVSILR